MIFNTDLVEAIELDNLRAICGPCNIDMTIRHMRNYVQEEYPQNLFFFDQKRYFTPNEWEEYNNPKKTTSLFGIGNLFSNDKKKINLIKDLNIIIFLNHFIYINIKTHTPKFFQIIILSYFRSK